MSEELITSTNLSKQLLKSILESAYVETHFDEDEDLVAREHINCYVMPSEDKERVKLLSQFGFKSNVNHRQRLECVNRINDEYIIVRATESVNDTLRFTWDIPITGGITKKAFVLAFKRFCSIPGAAVAEHGDLIK